MTLYALPLRTRATGTADWRAASSSLAARSGLEYGLQPLRLRTDAISLSRHLAMGHFYWHEFSESGKMDIGHVQMVGTETRVWRYRRCVRFLIDRRSITLPISRT